MASVALIVFGLVTLLGLVSLLPPLANRLKLPYSVLLGSDGTVRAKGLVNSREHLESLMVAHETGFASIQDYLRNSLESTRA